jgi:hypothetical protein
MDSSYLEVAMTRMRVKNGGYKIDEAVAFVIIVLSLSEGM